MLRTIGNFEMKYEKYEAAGTTRSFKVATRKLILSPFVTQVKAGKFLILKAQTC